MKVTIKLLIYFMLTSCVASPPNKFSIDNAKYDKILMGSMGRLSLNISCKRLSEELKLEKSKSDFEVINYNRYRMTDGVRFLIHTELKLTDPESQRNERYKTAYHMVENICNENPNLSYLDALALALKAFDVDIEEPL